MKSPSVKHPYIWRALTRAAAAVPAIAWGGAAALGTSPDSSSPINSGSPALLQEVVVTAEKRPELLVKAPVSDTVLSSARLEQLGAHSLDDIAAYTPGLNITSSGGSEQIVLRGISQGASFSPMVAVIVDGAAIGSSTDEALGGLLIPHLNLDDIERVEVLSGPQGTLYGASSMGGVISYVTKSALGKPLGGDVTVEGSGTAHGERSELLNGAVDIPLMSNWAALRLSGFYDDEGGFLSNVLTGQRDVNNSVTRSGRATLSLAPTDGLTVKLSAWLDREDRASTDTVVYKFSPEVPLVGKLDQGHLLLQPSRRTYDIYTGNVDWRLGPITLTSITSYSQTYASLLTDFAADPFGVLLIKDFGAHSASAISAPSTHKFSQELRISSPNNAGLRWMAGAYYTNEDSYYPIPLIGYGPSNQPIPFLDPAYALDGPSAYAAYAAFGNLTVPVTSRIEVTGGVRETHEDQQFETIASGFLAPILGGDIPLTKSRENHFDYMGTVRYEIHSFTYAYFRVATGFRPGGPNIAPGEPKSFSSDSLVNYEVGLKSRFWDGRASIDVAVFDVDWSKIQFQTYSPEGLAYYVNASSAASRGVDFTAQLVPLPGLTLAASFAYTDAHLTSAAPIVGGVEGEQMPNTAKSSGSLTGEYRFPVWNEWNGVVGVNYSYVGTRYASFNDDLFAPQFVLHPYSMVDLHAGMENGRYRLTAFVRNLGNVIGQTSAYTGFGLADVGVTRPREAGLRLSYQY